MQLREMRFARIDGTEVIVDVKSATEAKSAIRELRHKKKELALLRRRMARELSAARRAAANAENVRAKENRKRGVFATLKRVSRVFRTQPATADVEAIERDVARADEILHNLDSCIIQIEGKLLG